VLDTVLQRRLTLTGRLCRVLCDYEANLAG
jgi:hypothetical protein